MPAPRFLTAVAASLALLAGGCSSETDVTTAPAENPGAPAKKPAGTKDATTVAMKDIQFEPKNLEVKVGQTVTWVNEDDVEHNAVANEGEFKSELFGRAGTYDYKATQPGTIEYVCTVHPGMDGTLTVK